MTTQSYELIVVSGAEQGKKFVLSKQEMIVGREPSADISIDVAEISRQHTRLRLEANGYMIEDLGSTNGTFVNGRRLSGPHLLRPGERIQLGEAVTLAYQVAHDPDATLVSPVRQSASVPQGRPAAPPAPAPLPRPPAQPAYSGQVPSGPPAPGAPPVPEKEGKPWLWATLGCLGVMICLLVVGAIAFDTLNLYCTPPFNSLFGFLYTCP
ncbi:MAG: FHA domain-containing protein [Chloroflexota bacterium]|nr:FHA domain-containing protein [Chloroflexota bacterium]